MAERTEVFVYGASGHGKVVADICQRAGHNVVGFIDDGEVEGPLLGLPVCGDGVWLAEQARSRSVAVALGIGANSVRQMIAMRLSDIGIRLFTAIHPSAVIAPSATIGLGTVVMAGVAINPDSAVGEAAIINTGVVIEHDNRIGDYAHLSANASTGGTVTIGELTHIGLNACVLPNLSVGRNCQVGAGAVVVCDVPDDSVVVGVPARPLKR